MACQTSSSPHLLPKPHSSGNNQPSVRTLMGALLHSLRVSVDVNGAGATLPVQPNRRRSMISNWKRSAVMGAIGGAIATATVLATPSSGVTGIVLVRAAFAAIDAKAETDALEIELRTNGPAEVVVNHNKMTAGGSSGWHTHPG